MTTPNIDRHMSEKTLELNEKQLTALTQLLLGAAWADNELHGLESAAIDRILKNLVNPGLVPEEITEYVRSFQPGDLDVTAAVAALGIDDAEERRAILGLVATVIDADFTYDFQEGDYLKEVATALGAPQDEFRDHIVRTVRLKKISRS